MVKNRIFQKLDVKVDGLEDIPEQNPKKIDLFLGVTLLFYINQFILKIQYTYTFFNLTFTPRNGQNFPAKRRGKLWFTLSDRTDDR